MSADLRSIQPSDFKLQKPSTFANRVEESNSHQKVEPDMISVKADLVKKIK
jgi:hypothetical protein